MKISQLLLAVFMLIISHNLRANDYEDARKARADGDEKTAFNKFLIGATKGDSAAQIMVSSYYFWGMGVLKNYEKALYWAKKSAQNGHELAQYDLANMYMNGWGTLKDNVKAYMWFNIASNNDFLRKFGPNAERARDILEAKMTSDEVLRAQRLAQICLDSNYAKCD